MSFGEIAHRFNAKHGTDFSSKAVMDFFQSAQNKLKVVIQARGLSFDKVMFADRLS